MHRDRSKRPEDNPMTSHPGNRKPDPDQQNGHVPSGARVPRARVGSQKDRCPPGQHLPACRCGVPDDDEREHLATGFGTHLRALRDEVGLTQEALARRADLSREMVAHLETGGRRPETRTVRRLVTALLPGAANAERRKGERSTLNRLAADSGREWQRRQLTPRRDRAEARKARRDAFALKEVERLGKEIARLEAIRGPRPSVPPTKATPGEQG
ncbi:helix-turn-helix transcriptional regulator [Labedaea rhizosphaerae]|uniref:Helix-turn-helix protein n=1 Tax=Labedaea rhizosphaerae TaxID=598644 RepID=A0A4R6RUC5_LABRH|nr:helix-turn-helix domain-containing protein [Labedaea rhizosphaerae]TDP90512.1 helix-turn-helix protein [Labedaea rhizosphaerae]